MLPPHRFIVVVDRHQATYALELDDRRDDPGKNELIPGTDHFIRAHRQNRLTPTLNLEEKEDRAERASRRPRCSD